MSKQLLPCCWIFGGLFFFFTAFLSAQSPSFERLGAAEGLSQGMIYDLLQDRKGFLWFATKDGLNRYDGYTFQVFQNNPFDPFSISDNEVQSLLEDHLGRIWAGTVNDGLNVLDPQTGKFFHLKNLSTQSIVALAQTTDGAIWAGTTNGVNRVRIPDLLPSDQPNLEASAQIDFFAWEGQSSITQIPLLNRTVDLFGSRDGKLWVSTFRQVGFFDPATGLFQKVSTNPILANSESYNSHFKESPEGIIWVGQPGQLLRIQDSKVALFPLPELSRFPLTDMAFDAAGNMFVSTRKQIFKLQAAHSATPQNAHFDLFYRFPEEGVIGSTKLLADRGGLLWIGTNGYGLRKYNLGNHRFHHFLEGKSPRRILSDAQGRIWVWQAGLKFRRLHESENRLAEPLFTAVNLIQHDALQTSNGSLWVLCESLTGKQFEGVLIRLNSQTLTQEAQFHLPIRIGVFSQLFEAHDGNLWVLGNAGTLAKFDPGSSGFNTYDISATTGFKEASLSLSMDANGTLWIGTPHGLVKGVPDGNGYKFIVHKNNPDNPQTLNCNSILTSLNDPLQPERFLWLGTKGGGLNRLDKLHGSFKHFTTAEGLPNNVIYGILPDTDGNLWLSTNRGLSRFDPKTGIFQNFYKVDGLQDNEFNTVSFARAADGRLYFGGVNGITAFYPSELKSAVASPPVFITRLKINNQPASVANGILEKNIESSQTITLNHQQNQLTFEFAAMDFSAPEMNQFRYRLLGTKDIWVEPTTDNSATYAHLAPGKYVFEVVTGGSRGVWNSAPARLEIIILPPWWRTGWAYTLYFLIFAIGAWALYRFQMNRIRLENKLAFERNEAMRLAELDRLKTNFFSSVTHEFRTPLTLLLEPARQLLAETKDRAQRYRLELIKNNARRLLQFVNQLLDLSKLEAGQMPLDLRPGNPANTLKALVEQFKLLADQRGVHLELELTDVQTPVIFDEIKWEQVVSNLLSNAIKFTDKGGIVSLKLKAEKDKNNTHIHFRLEVSDTGIGISAKELPRVFDRFFQTEHTTGGTGIGLSLSKELVERMGGNISVSSSVGVGTTFIVSLPCEIAQIQKHDPGRQTLSTTHDHHLLSTSDRFVLHDLVENDSAEPSSLAHSTSPLLLIIEDDTELRKFLRASLPSRYRIAEAANGVEGIQMAHELVPDLVITDWVMPQKNGLEVTETLKNNPTTSHIPLILLTAKSSVESKLQGLNRGADAYLTKPFRADELVAHIESLLVSRQKLQAFFTEDVQNKTVLESSVSALPPEENEFLQRLIQVIEANLDNEAMDADGFARAVFISRSQLHRKISALTGLSLTEFVRNHRLDRARVMLAHHEGSISEIAWRTGFPNAKYFSTCFKDRFGVTPSGFVSGE